jgi:hypothetical protein
MTKILLGYFGYFVGYVLNDSAKHDRRQWNCMVKNFVG